MPSGPIEMPRMTEKLRPGTNEPACEWVVFPNQKLYLLPVVARQHRLTPRFTSTGVLVEVQQQDQEVAALVEKFLELTKTVEGNEVWLRTETAIADFFQLIRRLILTNYDLTDDEVTEILTVTSQQLSQLFETILQIVLRQ